MDAMTTIGEGSSNEPSLDPIAENPESDDEEDRLSALPEEILHRILSYLYMTEVIKTSLLSTKWRNLWKSHPFLKLHPSRSSKFIAKFGDIMDFIEHVLLLRDHHSSNLVYFYLHSRVNSEVHRFLESIVTAVNQGVQVIDTKQRQLHYSNRRAAGITTTTLDPCIFDSGVVSVFKFAVTDSKFRIQIPISICSAAHLRIVHLNGIVLPEGDSKKRLHLICPILEELSIRDCFHKHLSVLSISTPKLETLSIYNYLNKPFKNIHGKCILEISTPKLKSFSYIGYSYVDYSFKNNLPFLTHATVQLYLEKGNDVELETNFLRSIKILKAISNAKSLWMDKFEIYSWVPNTLRKEVLVLNPFTGLRDLTLRSIPSLSSVHGMVYLLLTTCNVLETFVWKVRKGGTVKEDEGEEHEHVMLSEGSFSHLKLVKTMNLRGHKNELIFLRFLLKSAVVLEEMTITTANLDKNEKDQEHLMQRKFMEELQALRLFSPSTNLSFKINNVVSGPATFQKVEVFQVPNTLMLRFFAPLVMLGIFAVAFRKRL